MSDEEKVLREVYSLFEDRLSFDEFRTKFNLLPNDKWNFARAVSIFQQYLKCKNCDPNIGMVVLCSCADAIQLIGGRGYSKANFREFYLRYCPPEYRRMPIEPLSTEKRKTPITIDEQFLDYVYQTFRCSLIHRGIKNLHPLHKDVDSEDLVFGIKKEKGETEKDWFALHLVEFIPWFEKATFESLYAILIKSTTKNPSPN